MNLWAFFGSYRYFQGAKSRHLPAPQLPAKYRHAQSWKRTKCGDCNKLSIFFSKLESKPSID
ncbi:hypothetical protein AERO8C_70269 [Aeromonas veronii]|uniref:Uncharacterized protein n=1 Tax=Aeromonas veronii TaxID=654 RepID=A0A653LBB2_AERVE|nr:hypothetical protein AERO8C_70269 [Aeromonas veronii]